MTDDEVPEAAARALALGGEGRGRLQVAAALGFSADELDAAERQHPAFALALARADAAARAWWEALPREAVLEGARFSLPSWQAAMRRLWDGDGKAPASPPALQAPPTVTARVVIPDNGRRRRRLPETYYQNRDARWWRDEPIRELEVELMRDAEALKHQRRVLREEAWRVAEREARMAWLRTAPLDAEQPEQFLPDDPEDEDEDDHDRLD
ncbi:MAG TPA: hypothetical protein VFE13_07465 [Caulobacteraceae bacterium]|nr:hypothetical protein [Caulobacteraceae bacterium]